MSAALVRAGAAFAAIALAFALSACGGDLLPAPEGPTGYLVISNAGGNSLEVLARRGRASDLERLHSTGLGGNVLPCGVVLGPDGRLYVADRAGARVLVYEPDEVVAGGRVSPAATITSSALEGACGLAFDAEGRLWVADQRGSTFASPAANALHRFDAVAGSIGAVEVTPARTLLLADDPVDLMPSWFVANLYVDAEGALWFSDVWRWTVSRVSDPGSFPPGVSDDVIPDLQFDSRDPDDPSSSLMHNPQAMLRDAEGNLYVASAGQPWVLRYDADSLSGGRVPGLEPSAVLELPLALQRSGDGPVALALDDAGALWVAANADQRLFRVPRPGRRDVTPVPSVITRWGDGGLLLGSTAVFLEVPSR